MVTITLLRILRRLLNIGRMIHRRLRHLLAPPRYRVPLIEKVLEIHFTAFGVLGKVLLEMAVPDRQESYRVVERVFGLANVNIIHIPDGHPIRKNIGRHCNLLLLLLVFRIILYLSTGVHLDEIHTLFIINRIIFRRAEAAQMVSPPPVKKSAGSSSRHVDVNFAALYFLQFLMVGIGKILRIIANRYSMIECFAIG